MFFLQLSPAALPLPPRGMTVPSQEHDLFHQPTQDYEIPAQPETRSFLPVGEKYLFQLHPLAVNQV